MYRVLSFSKDLVDDRAGNRIWEVPLGQGVGTLNLLSWDFAGLSSHSHTRSILIASHARPPQNRNDGIIGLFNKKQHAFIVLPYEEQIHELCCMAQHRGHR